jgi:epoxyqueuosine reductase QueG
MTIKRSDVIRVARDYVLSVDGNSALDAGSYFDEPIIGFASSDDVIFDSYKEIIGRDHLTPKEAFEASLGDGTFHGGSVISIALPIGETVRASNRKQEKAPSREWALCRAYSDVIIPGLSHHMEDFFRDAGYHAVAPSASAWIKTFPTATGPNSIWSERHIAYAAGLGTFSLNDGFITERGIAVRFTSLVTDMEAIPDAKVDGPYNSHCLFCSKGICGACIKRCPVGAISENGHDRIKCMAFVYGDESKRLAVSYGSSGKSAGCGLCQTKVPCEFSNPTKGIKR